MGKSEIGNLAKNLGAIPEQSKGSGSSQIWPTQNYSDGKCLIWGIRNRQFYDEYENKDWPYTPNVEYSERWPRGNMNPKAPKNAPAIPFLWKWKK